METKLGFSKIRELIAQETSNQLAHRMVEEIAFTSNYDRLLRELQLTEELRQILLMESSFPMQDFIDLSDVLNRLKVVGSVIELPALFDLKCSLRTITDCVDFLMRDDLVSDAADGHRVSDSEGAHRYPRLRELADEVYFDEGILRTLNKLIDDKGDLFDDATPELLEIRRAMNRKRGEVDSQISRSLAFAKREGWAPENAEVTIRNGRLVIPMLDTHRRKIKGFIHDESATRQTAFLEPSEVVELNNDLRELEFAERHEIQRILAKFSDALRPCIPNLLDAYWFLARIDFLRAKARFALTVGGVLPIVDNETKISWLDARHPLLYLNKHDAVVPFNMNLDVDHHILIISGPNAGGKSVCLKAVGLIQYMLQCGLLVPCRETSEFGIFDRLFIDIGDQQSIDNDLSTYSSHLQNMKNLLAVADHKTLFLLDELGGGTEPRSGCAIAEAVLEELYSRHSFGVVTTHFADLKLLADNNPRIVNGAMLFDTERMRPLYQLAIGHPGSSFAFEIATNIGFPLYILEAAEQKVGTQMLNYEHQLQQMELDKKEIERQRTELSVQDNLLNEVVEKYQALLAQLESQKKEIIAKARQEARDIIADSNKAVERTISDIRTAQADKQRTREAREILRQHAAQLDEQILQDQAPEPQQVAPAPAKRDYRPKTGRPQPQSSETSANEPIAVGSIVRIDGQDTFAQVVEIKGKKAIVESNSLRMTIPLARLSSTAKKTLPVERPTKQEGRFQSIYDDMNEKRKTFNYTLDLRGHRAEEAVEELQRFLDDAQLLSEKELRILHGKGFGILKTIVRQQLMSHPEVKNFHSERIEFGGDGITVVHLK